MPKARPPWRLPVPGRKAGRVRAMAQHILSEHQFHRGLSIWQRIIDWVERHLHGGPDLNIPGGNLPWLSDVVIFVLVAAIVAVVVIAVRNGAFARFRHPQGQGVVVTDEGQTLAPDEWRRQAERLAAEGRFREALRCRYRALVADLAWRGVVDEIPGRTSGDYERLVGARLPEVSAQFSTITRLFERCWYGRDPSDQRAQVIFDEMAQAILDNVGPDSRPPRPPRSELVGVS